MSVDGICPSGWRNCFCFFQFCLPSAWHSAQYLVNYLVRKSHVGLFNVLCVLLSFVTSDRSHLILPNNLKRQDLLFPFHSMEIGSERWNHLVKVTPWGSSSKGLNPDNLTQESRCLEALQRLIEGWGREGRGAEAVPFFSVGGLWTAPPPQPCLLTLLS